MKIIMQLQEKKLIQINLLFKRNIITLQSESVHYIVILLQNLNDFPCKILAMV